MASQTTIGKGGRFLLNLTALLVVLPLLFLLAQLPLRGLTHGVGLAHISPPAAVSLALLVAAVGLILWKGWVTVTLGGVLVGMIGLGFWDGARGVPSPAAKELWLTIGARSPVVGADVYCNGVHLGIDAWLRSGD